MDHSSVIDDLVDMSPVVGTDRPRVTTGGVYGHENPATGAVQATVPMAGPAEVHAAIDAARAALPGWRARSGTERRDILQRLAALLEEHEPALAELQTLENGCPSAFSGIVASVIPAEYSRYYAGLADKIEGRVYPIHTSVALDYGVPEPYGVVAVIIPWNGPVSSIGQKVVPALAAGNTVVLKPPELAPFTPLYFAELCRLSGLPPGVLNVVPGRADAGEALVSSSGVDKISFTGGGGTARSVLASASQTLTPVVLELGGKSANIVFEDADLDAAITMAVQNSVATLSGQGCILPTRLLVQRSVYQSVIEEVVDLVDSLPYGAPSELDTLIGPVVSRGHRDRIQGVIDGAVERGVKRVAGDATSVSGLDKGFYIHPTVFADVPNDDPVARDEIFGPVLCVMPFDSAGDAVAIANDSPYGLAGYVWTQDITRAHTVASQLDAGYVSVNGFNMIPPTAPFGGFKQSGFGKEGGSEGLHEFLRLKNVYVGLE